MKIGPMMPLAEIAVHTVHLQGRLQGLGGYFIRSGGPPKHICLGVRLSVNMEVGFMRGPEEVKEIWYLLGIFFSTLTVIALRCFLPEAVGVCIVCILYSLFCKS